MTKRTKKNMIKVDSKKVCKTCGEITDMTIGITFAAAGTCLAINTVAYTAKPICDGVVKGAKFVGEKLSGLKKSKKENKPANN